MKQFLLLTTIVVFLINCKKDSPRLIDSNYKPDVSPAKFTNSTNITNPYYPLAAGKKYIYEGQTDEGLERVEEQRLSTTKTILGITCIVGYFKAYVNNKLVEETWDWYAQDNDGNLWYFGEEVNNFNPDGSLKDHGGSWEAGKDGAQPGLIMPAILQVGYKYREEYYFNHAEDEAEIIGTGLTVTIPLGTYTNCIKTKNWTALEPDAMENKIYAPGIGLIKEINITDNFEIKLVMIQ